MSKTSVIVGALETKGQEFVSTEAAAVARGHQAPVTGTYVIPVYELDNNFNDDASSEAATAKLLAHL